jgi:hypothetical protein
MVGADVPHRRLGSTHQNQKQALGDLGLCQVFFGQFMLALPGLTMHKRNALGFRIPMNTTAKASRHAHEVCVVQSVVRSGQRPPLHPEAAGPHSSCGNKHSTQSGLRNRSCPSRVPHIDRSTTQAYLGAKHIFWSGRKRFRFP